MEDDVSADLEIRLQSLNNAGSLCWMLPVGAFLFYDEVSSSSQMNLQSNSKTSYEVAFVSPITEYTIKAHDRIS